MSKFTCPYCYGQHTVESCGIKCSDRTDGIGTGVCKCGVSGVTRDSYGWIPQLSKKKCLSCNSQRALHYYCPDLISSDGQMIREIPSGFIKEHDNNLPIALIGAKATGKSNYIAVLIKTITSKMSGAFNCSLDTACGDDTPRNYNDYYYNPLYGNGQVIDATDAAVEIPPLIYPLRFYDSKKVATLTFYDTAGENLDGNDKLEIFNRYIPNSKGIILLLDPLQVPSIRKQLSGKMPLPEINTDVSEILSRVIQNIRNVKNIKGTINIPLALAFTKMDALEKFNILPEDCHLREESEHLKYGGFVLSDFRNTNIEMQDLLENWLDSEIIQMMKQFSKYAIFGLSSLGDIPHGNKIAGDGIHPKRVLDPLLWILAENKYIKKIK